MWTVTGSGATEAATGHHRNEDVVLVDDALGLYAVADGFGGHPAGQVASAAAVATVSRNLRNARKELAAAGDMLAITQLIERAVQEACGEVHEMARARPEWGGMCCALTLAVVVGDRAVLAHVGNSRLYLVRGGELHRLTIDHTLPAELAVGGVIPREELEQHPLSHVLTRSIGSHEGVLVDTLTFDLAPGDRLLICTRGLSTLVDEAPQVVAEAVEDEALDTVAQNLIAQAQARGPDGDVSVVVVKAGPAEGDTEGTDTHRKLGALGSPFLFEGLTLPQLTHVLEACRLESIGPGQALVAQGDRLDRLVIGLDGALELLVDGEVVESLGAGNHAGATALLAPRPARATLQAVTPARVLTLDAADFRSLSQLRPRLGAQLMERLAVRLSQELVALQSGGTGATAGDVL